MFPHENWEGSTRLEFSQINGRQRSLHHNNVACHAVVPKPTLPVEADSSRHMVRQLAQCPLRVAVQDVPPRGDDGLIGSEHPVLCSSLQKHTHTQAVTYHVRNSSETHCYTGNMRVLYLIVACCL